MSSGTASCVEVEKSAVAVAGRHQARGYFLAMLVSGLVTTGLVATQALADNTGIDVKLGTLGTGIEVGHAFSDSLAIRLGLNQWSYKKDRTENNVDYDAKLKLSSFELLGEWYPFSGVFRLNAGLVSNSNKLTLAAKPSGSGQFTFNGNTYSASQVGSVAGQVDFKKLAPYLGIGWGSSAGSGFTLVSDIGILFQGKPRSQLTVTCGSGVNCTQLTSDVDAVQAKLDDALKNFRYYPVASIGIGYRF